MAEGHPILTLQLLNTIPHVLDKLLVIKLQMYFIIFSLGKCNYCIFLDEYYFEPEKEPLQNVHKKPLPTPPEQGRSIELPDSYFVDKNLELLS